MSSSNEFVGRCYIYIGVKGLYSKDLAKWAAGSTACLTLASHRNPTCH